MMLAPTFADVEREMRELLADAREAVFTPSPLDLLDIARLHREHPEFALRLAEEAGRAFDQSCKENHGA